MDVSSLSNQELRKCLVQFGENPGPVVATTRSLYEKKLKDLLAAQENNVGGGRGESKFISAETPTKQSQNSPKSKGSDSPLRHSGEPTIIRETPPSHARNDSSDEDYEEGEEEEEHSEAPPIRHRQVGRLYPDLPKNGEGPIAASTPRGSEYNNGFARVVSPRMAQPRDIYAGHQASSGRLPLWASFIIAILVAIFGYFLLQHGRKYFDEQFAS